MANIAIFGSVGSPSRLNLSGRAIAALVAIVTLVFVIVAGFVFANAWLARQQLIEKAVTDAASTSDDVDQVIEMMRDLLLSLSTSPALKSGDLQTFHQQLIEMPKPEGVWIVLWDQERVLLNSMRPFGSPLPRIAEYPGGAALYQALRASEGNFSVQQRMRGITVTREAVPVHLRVLRPDGQMAGVLSAMLSAPQLRSIVDRQRLAHGWRGMVLDRLGQPLSGKLVEGVPDPAALFGRAILKSAASPQGYFVEERERAPGLVVAFHRSSLSGFTALTILPLADSFAPVARALSQIAIAALALILGGALVYLVISREAAVPIERMSARVRESESDLRLINTQLRAVLAGISDAYVMLDHDFRIVAASEAAIAWFRLDPARAIGAPFWYVVPYDDDASKLLRQCMSESRPLHRELPSTFRPGRWIDFRMYPSAYGASIFFRDITARRRAIAKVEETKELLQASLDAVASPLVIIDDMGTIAFSNRAWRQWGPCVGVGQAGSQIAPSTFRSHAAAIAGASARDLVTAVDQALRGDSLPPGLVFGRHGRHFHLRAGPFSVEGRRHAVAVFEDVTEIAAARDEIQELSGALLTLQERERRQIAEELHDSTAQHLVAVALNLMRLSQHALSDAKPILEEIEGSVDEALKQIRSVSYLLHPPNLESDGFESALRSFATGFSQRTGLATNLRFDADASPLQFEVQRSLLRVVQEALMNVHRHAEASQVWIRARQQAGWLEIRVVDDGVGIAAARSGYGVGIPGMQSRLKQSGGRLEIRRGRRGTAVIAKVPVRPPPRLADLIHRA